jgi:glutamate-1-semialdehyde 2,1-aminomutase
VLMERIAPAGDVYQTGTLSGNPLAMAAALATFELLDTRAYARLEHVTERLARGLQQAANDTGFPLTLQHVPGLVTPFFRAGLVRDYADAASCDLDGYGAWCRSLLASGVYPPASQFEAWFPSLAHTDRDLDRTLEAARVAFEEIAP